MIGRQSFSMVVAATLVGCGATRPAPSQADEREVPHREERDAGPEGEGCASISVAFDSRALPTNAGPEGYDLFVRGEAWELAGSAPGAQPRVYLAAGSGAVEIAFDATSPEEAIARCELELLNDASTTFAVLDIDAGLDRPGESTAGEPDPDCMTLAQSGECTVDL